MKIEVWTWGTGGPFGRELGLSPDRRRRGHTATSIIASDEGEVEGEGKGVGVHILVDAGAPSVETMIERGVGSPDLLFLTHPHFDHVSDLDRLANSRMRGLMVERGIRDFGEAERCFAPLPVIGTDGCLNHSRDGVKARFGYLERLVSFKPISTFGLWHRVRRDGTILPRAPCEEPAPGPKDRSLAGVETVNLPGEAVEGSRIDRYRDPATEELFPLEFQALPVRHSKHAPGSCLFIFRFFRLGSCKAFGPLHGSQEVAHITRNVVISGDFKSMEDWVEESPDLVDPACLVLDSNTIKASGRYHASLEENKAHIDRWSSGREEVLVLLNHLSGYGDYVEGFYDHVPRDEDWRASVDGFAPKPKVTIRIAEDGACYRL
ncbi:MAG TPA: MBL fold metallo-hydrolase [Methanothrix sp.]|nr:MBL fold metallo-hydrolase [Methanothrix sp.]